MLTYKLTLPLAVAELAKFPGFLGTTLLAPGRNAPILRLVFFSSTVLLQRLMAGDLVIFGEHALRNWPDKTVLDLLASLVETEGIGLAYDQGTIPPAHLAPLQERARRDGIALLELPPFCSRVEMVDSVVFNRILTEEAPVSWGDGFYQDMIRASSRSGIQGLVVNLANLTRNPVVLTDSFQKIKAFDLVDCSNLKLQETLTPIVSPNQMDVWPHLFANTEVDKLIHRIPIQLDGDQIVETAVIPISDDANRMGFLYVLEINKQSQLINLHQMKQAAVVAYLELGRELEKRQQERRLRTNFVYNILFHPVAPNDHLTETARFHKWRLDIPHRVLYFRIQYHRESSFWEQAEDMVMSKVNQLFPNSLFLGFGNEIVVIIECQGDSSETNKCIQRLATSIMEKIPPRKVKELQAGVGTAKDGIDGLRESYKEAQTAAWFNPYPCTKRVQFYEDMGVLKLLSILPRDEALKYMRESLGPIMDYDRQNTSSLLPTLVFYFLKADLDIAATAAGLFLHPNTVRYRLRKIEELLGFKLESCQGVVDIYTAVRLGVLWGGI